MSLGILCVNKTNWAEIATAFTAIGAACPFFIPPTVAAALWLGLLIPVEGVTPPDIAQTASNIFSDSQSTSFGGLITRLTTDACGKAIDKIAVTWQGMLCQRDVDAKGSQL